MNQELNLSISEKNAELILVKFEVLVEIVELIEGDLEALKDLKRNVLNNLDQLIMVELSGSFEKKGFSKTDLTRLIRELNEYESAEEQLKYINQKVDSEFWNRIEGMLNNEILNEMRLKFLEIEQ